MATLTVSAEDEKRVKALGFLSNKGTDNFSGRWAAAVGLLWLHRRIQKGIAALRPQ